MKGRAARHVGLRTEAFRHVPADQNATCTMSSANSFHNGLMSSSPPHVFAESAETLAGVVSKVMDFVGSVEFSGCNESNVCEKVPPPCFCVSVRRNIFDKCHIAPSQRRMASGDRTLLIDLLYRNEKNWNSHELADLPCKVCHLHWSRAGVACVFIGTNSQCYCLPHGSRPMWKIDRQQLRFTQSIIILAPRLSGRIRTGCLRPLLTAL